MIKSTILPFARRRSVPEAFWNKNLQNADQQSLNSHNKFVQQSKLRETVKVNMPQYSYLNTGRLYDMVLPKPVIDICSKGNPGDCSQFHFVHSVDSVYASNVKPSLSVTNLDDGSWNITNKKGAPHDFEQSQYLWLMILRISLDHYTQSHGRMGPGFSAIIVAPTTFSRG